MNGLPLRIRRKQWVCHRAQQALQVQAAVRKPLVKRGLKAEIFPRPMLLDTSRAEQEDRTRGVFCPTGAEGPSRHALKRRPAPAAS